MNDTGKIILGIAIGVAGVVAWKKLRAGGCGCGGGCGGHAAAAPPAPAPVRRPLTSIRDAFGGGASSSSGASARGCGCS
jgi:hypothetical protein